MINARDLEKRIKALQDEVIIGNMDGHRGQSRELSMCLTRLQEAQDWAVRYGVKLGSHMVVPREEILALAQALKDNDIVVTKVTDDSEEGST